jgi:hypothetical protein
MRVSVDVPDGALCEACGDGVRAAGVCASAARDAAALDVDANADTDADADADPDADWPHAVGIKVVSAAPNKATYQRGLLGGRLSPTG